MSCGGCKSRCGSCCGGSSSNGPTFAQVVAPKCGCACNPIPPEGTVERRCQCGLLQVIASDIKCDRTLSGLLLIADEVHVLAGARLTIEPGSVVFFRNGPLADVAAGQLPYASLVIDSGAAITADNVDFKNQSDVANNTGGLFIVGTNQASIATFGATLPGYTSVVADAAAKRKRSKLSNVRFTNLGSNAAGIAALTLFQARDNDEEVRVSGLLYVNNSGADGVSIYGGTRTWETVSVNDTLDAAIALDYSATLLVSKSLTLTSAVQASAVHVCGIAGSTNRLQIAIGAWFTGRAAHQAQTGLCTYTYDGSVFHTPPNDPLYWSDLISGSAALIQGAS